MIETTGQLRPLDGKYQSFERFGAERIGQDLVLLTDLYESTDFPFAWRLDFYHGKGSTSHSLPKADPWRVISVHFDSDFTSLGRDGPVVSSR